MKRKSHGGAVGAVLVLMILVMTMMSAQKNGDFSFKYLPDTIEGKISIFFIIIIIVISIMYATVKKKEP